MYIAVSHEPGAWLQRVHHDLVKRLLWPARDRLAMGGPPTPGELCVQLVDDDGQGASAEILWRALLDAAPVALPASAAQAFGAAVVNACAAAARDDLQGVLALDDAFQTLARNVKEATANTATPTTAARASGDPPARK